MLPEPTARTLVIGVGNLLLSDEGVGVHLVQRLGADYQMPEEVLVLDGGTLGLDLLYYLEGAENVLLLDAVEMRQAPGTLLRLEGDEVPAFMTLKMSPHEVGIPDMLFAAKLKGIFPPNLVLLGVQPEKLELGMELSETVSAVVPELLEQTLAQLRVWGHAPQALS